MILKKTSKSTKAKKTPCRICWKEETCIRLLNLKSTTMNAKIVPTVRIKIVAPLQRVIVKCNYQSFG